MDGTSREQEKKKHAQLTRPSYHLLLVGPECLGPECLEPERIDLASGLFLCTATVSANFICLAFGMLRTCRMRVDIFHFQVRRVAHRQRDVQSFSTYD
jgi:hypothetical protein